MTVTRTRRFLTGSLTYATIIAVTLLVVDGICIFFNLFPPTHNYGDPDFGWRPARATGKMETGVCIEFSTGERVTYQRNEDGVRVDLDRSRVAADTSSAKIAITGDSQTDLCAPNALTHSGVLESELKSKGIPTTVLPYGSGKFSPLQDYLAFRKVLQPYLPQVLVINLYTGNDFHDMLRVDDRPHFARGDSGYYIADPVWYTLDDPRVHRKSRVLFAMRSLADKVGIRRLYLRVSELRRLGVEQGGELTGVIAYMRDLWKAREPAVGYANAFTAQFLNQQLFFHHFPPAKEESLRRLRALMRLIRMEHPGLLLVMSPLPSYELTGEQPVDQLLIQRLGRLPLTYEGGIQQERTLYEHVRSLAEEEGWAFVDNLAALQAYRGAERLYNDFDYHFLPVANALIGRAQAAVIAERLRLPAGNPTASQE